MGIDARKLVLADAELMTGSLEERVVRIHRTAVQAGPATRESIAWSAVKALPPEVAFDRAIIEGARALGYTFVTLPA